jgi:ABC-type sugar transport system permease subunit
MSILRGIVRWFLSLAIAAMLTAGISFGVLHATVLNRTTTTGWLRDSGVYQKVLGMIQLQDTGQSVITKTELQTALNNTFPPPYLQQETEVVINATYDWVEGKTPKISFSIPVDQKRAEFSANLATLLQARLATLPQCKTRINPDVNNPTCIPQGMSAADLSKQLTQLDDGSDFLNKPLTADSFSGSFAAQNTLPTTWVPATVANIDWLLIALPIGIVVFAVGYIFLSDDKLKGWGIISRRIFINGLLLTIVGVLVWQMSGSFKLSNILNMSEASAIIDPLFQKVVPALGSALAVMSAGVMVVGGVSWGTTLYLRHRNKGHQKPKTYEPPRDLPAPPMPDETKPHVKAASSESPPPDSERHKRSDI